MLTEEEAKTRICPATLQRSLHHGGYVPVSNCVASGCMAWRWETTARLTYRPTESLSGISNNVGTYWSEPHRPDFINDAWLWDAARGHWYVGKPQGAIGRCGLAGEP